MAQTDAKLASQDGRVVALKRVSGDPGPGATPQESQGVSGSITEPSGAFYGARFKPAPKTPISNRKAVDPVLLTGVTKSGNPANGWTLQTTWSGGTAPFTVVSSTDPSFQINVVTNAAELPLFNLNMKVGSSDPGKFFNVVDGTTVSPAVQGSGFDPLPSPKVASASTSNAWWGDLVTLTGQYFDPIAVENLAYINDLGVKASSALPPVSGSSYSTSVTFEIPEDARSFLATVYRYGVTDKTGAPGIAMSPPGIGPYSTIKGVSFSPQTGHVWVAAQGIVDDVDLFKVTPTAVSVGSFTRPYISRVTTTGSILVIDRDSDLEIKEIDVAGHAVTPYAWTADDSFTRTIDPVGLAVDPDGSVAYVADGGTGRVVRIPRDAGPGSSEITDQWGGRSFSFVDPVGIDVAPGHQVIVADNSTQGTWKQWTWELTGPSSASAQHWAGPNVHSIEVDRGVSSTGHFNYVIDTVTGMTETFNRNQIGTDAPRNHGGRVYGLADGTLRLNYDWVYGDLRRGPKRVLLSNAVPGYPYPTQFQDVDRVIELRGEAWGGVPIHLRLVDPPDSAAYAPDGGWPYTGTDPPEDPFPPKAPYEGNDNIVWGWEGGADYGISVSPTGPWHESIDPTPGADNTYTYYLKVPPDVSGENFQVEITKCDPSSAVLPDQVVGMSGVYTSWKRIFIERDRMFRKGGVLAEDYLTEPGTCGAGFPKPCCGQADALPCDQVKVYGWTNVSAGDKVAFFDEQHTFETAAETRDVVSVTVDPDGHGLKLISLNRVLSHNYLRSTVNTADPAQYQPTFSNHHSAGYGVVSDCALLPNQINQVDPLESCFYEADTRGLEMPFGDAFVELRAPRAGMSAASYVAGGSGVLDPGQVQTYSTDFSQTWFDHFIAASGGGGYPFPQNYFHMTGVANNLTTASGWSLADYDMIMISTGWIKDIWGFFPEYDRQAAVHELGHMFRVDPCDTLNHHDDNFAWCGAEGGECLVDPLIHERCVMYENKNDPEWYTLILNDVNRFCCANLFGPVAGQHCGNESCLPEDGIRNDVDPE